MGAAVQLEDPVVEVLHAEAQAGHPDAADGRELGLRDRARLALERNLVSRAPRAVRRHPRDERFELAGRQERRRTAAEIDELEGPPRDRRPIGVELPFPPQQVEILLDLPRVLVGVNPEVAEMTALAAERDVQVQAQRGIRGSGRRIERDARVRRHGLGGPDRKWRVIRDEIAADLGLLEVGDRRWIGHISLYTCGRRAMLTREAGLKLRPTNVGSSTSRDRPQHQMRV